jgi:gamma-glutamyltranspeptidase/glutathione hydrolase
MAMGRNGVVAAADGLASLAGARMLMKGGNAIDAIVAAAAALNVVEPMMSGMTGFGGFMMVHLADQKKTLALDMMGISPAAASRANMTERDLGEGYKAPIVWGTVAGWAEALKAHGTMSLGDVFEPAIELAAGGFPVSAFDVASITRSFDKLSQFPTTARIFLPDGRPPKVGWILKQPDLARSLERVAVEGAQSLYTGALADEIVGFLQENGGLLTKRDLAGFTVRWR